MSSIGIFFGSDEGNTERVAGLIHHQLQSILGLSSSSIDLYDIADVTQVEFSEYQYIILGIPTWDFGEIQSDWEEFWEDIEAIDFNNKVIALFGLGDQFGYGDYFLDAMGMLHDVVASNGASIVGYWSTEGYEFEASKAETTHPISGEPCFVGLAIDEDQQDELTEMRVQRWCEQLRREWNLDS
ncbi:flavodoxin [Eionea flava]